MPFQLAVALSDVPSLVLSDRSTNWITESVMDLYLFTALTFSSMHSLTLSLQSTSGFCLPVCLWLSSLSACHLFLRWFITLSISYSLSCTPSLEPFFTNPSHHRVFLPQDGYHFFWAYTLFFVTLSGSVCCIKMAGCDAGRGGKAGLGGECCALAYMYHVIVFTVLSRLRRHRSRCRRETWYSSAPTDFLTTWRTTWLLNTSSGYRYATALPVQLDVCLIRLTITLTSGLYG